MRSRCSLLRRLVLAVALLPGLVAAAAEPDFVGSLLCVGCHSDEYSQWRGSHHDLAMQKPRAETVLGDFDDAVFTYFGRETRFYTHDGKFIVNTDGPDGSNQDFEVAWVFGVYPLQQYLLPLEGGRLQALSIAWDSRPEEEGGQRWYHLYPDEEINHDDPLHWTGPYQNWNTRCAECHSTDLKKNYDANRRSFDTQFREEDVGCEACHGPGSEHVAKAYTGAVGAGPDSGLATDLRARGQWEFVDDAPIATRRDALQNQQQIDSCGRCHARRSTLGDYVHGKPLSDTHRLSLLGNPLYHHDGQILDEVYVYGSFVQSKMHMAGVVCANCHEPHSNELRAEGNGVCAQCHKASVFDTDEHHGHASTPAGGQCVDCHMPATVYMGVDARRDHSMRIPRPDLSVVVGTPNACTGCHSDRTDQWAVDALRERGVTFDTGSHPALAMAALQRGDQRAAGKLLSTAADDSAPPIWRATALEQSIAAGAPGAVGTAAMLLSSPDPLLRVSAVRALQDQPLQQRYAMLAPLMSDPVTGVRSEVAVALAGVPLGELDEATREDLLDLFDEYRAIQLSHADMPSVQMQLGLFSLARGDLPAAENAYREALELNPQLLPARLNLADLLRAAGREEEARGELTEAIAFAPQSGDAMHALGLLEIRAGNPDTALDWLGKAAALESNGSRHRFVYAVAQHDVGDRAGALITLRRLHGELPGDEQTLLALVNYSAEGGDLEGAGNYARKLLQLAPDNPSYQRLMARLGQR